MNAHDWFDCLPKLELHLHLEGAVPLPALLELVLKYDRGSGIRDLAGLEKLFRFRDFAHFLELWSWKNRFIREQDDFTFMAEAVARDLHHQNYRYAEVFYSPADFSEYGPGTQRITEAIRRGLDRVPELQVALVADLVRDHGPESGHRTLAEVIEVQDLGVVGIGLGGSEAEYPPELFKEVFSAARRAGMYTCAHAGEAAGPGSIRGALELLQVERIGHATRAEEDSTLLDHLAERQIPIEVCPVSNVRTGFVPSLELHPVRRFFERGLMVTINTDDPLMFQNSLAGELRQLYETLGFTHDEVRTLLLNAIEASWLSPVEKDALRAEFRNDKAWSRPQ